MQDDQGDPNVNNGDDVFVAPPDADGFDSVDLEPPPAWPKVVGIISIVMGALNECCGVLSGGMALAAPAMLRNAEQSGAMEGGFPPIVMNPPALNMALLAIGLGWAIVLIVAGVMTVSRKAQGRKLHLIWAAGAVVLTIASIYIQLQVQAEIAQWIQDNPDATFSQQQSQGGPIGMFIGIAIAVLLGFAWPAFCLLWFGVAKKRPEVGADETI